LSPSGTRACPPNKCAAYPSFLYWDVENDMWETPNPIQTLCTFLQLDMRVCSLYSPEEKRVHSGSHPCRHVPNRNRSPVQALTSSGSCSWEASTPSHGCWPLSLILRLVCLLFVLAWRCLSGIDRGLDGLLEPLHPSRIATPGNPPTQVQGAQDGRLDGLLNLLDWGRSW